MTDEQHRYHVDQASALMNNAYREAVRMVTGRTEIGVQDVHNLDVIDQVVLNHIVAVNSGNAMEQLSPRVLFTQYMVEEIARAAALGAMETAKAAEKQKSEPPADQPPPEQSDQPIPQFVRGDPQAQQSEAAPEEIRQDIAA